MVMKLKYECPICHTRKSLKDFRTIPKSVLGIKDENTVYCSSCGAIMWFKMLIEIEENE